MYNEQIPEYIIEPSLQQEIEDLSVTISEHGIAGVSKERLKRAFFDWNFEFNNCLEQRPRARCNGLVEIITNLFKPTEIIQDVIKYCRENITGDDEDNPLAGCLYQKIVLFIDGMHGNIPGIDKKIQKYETERNLKELCINN